MNEQVIWPNLWVAAAFGGRWVGFGLAIGILAIAVFIVVFNYLKFHRPMVAALKVRLDATAEIGRSDIDDTQAQDLFAERFDAIDAAMMSGGARAVELRHAWIEFSETFVDKNDRPLQATTRPEGYFLHLGDDTRVLAWWANIAVAAGLTLTFLGIIAALVGAVQAMGGGADMGRMQSALIGLLTITAAKFWTSIGGVVASIILRWFDRHWHSRVQRELELLTDRIERGTLFYPPQRFAALQLRELEQQSVALTDFSTKLAASIGDALNTTMQPVVAGLSTIQQSLNEFRDSGFDKIGENVGAKINEHAGAQMAALAVALTQMTDMLGKVTTGLDGASEDAGKRIADAAAQFAEASKQMLEAVRALSETARAEQSAATKEAIDALTAVTAGIRAAFGGLREQVDVAGKELTSGASLAAEQNAKVLANAAAALAAVVGGIQADLGKTLKDGIEQTGRESERAIEAAFASFAMRFDEHAAALIDALRDTAAGMGSYAGAIERSTTASSDHADRLAAAGREAQAVSTMLGKAANDVASAAEPIRRATDSIDKAATWTNNQLRELERRILLQQDVMQGIADSFERTNASATQAWDNYRTRFTEIDEALGRALEQIRGAAAQHATDLNTQVGRIDLALAEAAERLAAAFDPLQNFAADVTDAVERLSRSPAGK